MTPKLCHPRLACENGVRLFPAWRSASQFAFDVGTANIRVISLEDGIVLDEPAICCFDRSSSPSQVVAVGAAALPMLGRTGKGLRIQRPLDRGVLQDLDATRALLAHARRTVSRRYGWSRKPILVGIPADATEVERRALLTAAQEAGLRRVRLVSEPMAAAIGAGLPVGDAQGSMLIECGAGITEVVVFSLGGVAVRQTVRAGGDGLDQAIADHLHLHHRFAIGKQTAQQLKLQICEAAVSRHGDQQLELRGGCLETGLPATLKVQAAEFDQVMRKHVRVIVEAVKVCLEQTPAELSCDIFEAGVTLTGGSAYVPWLGAMISQVSGLGVTIADNADQCVALGMREMLRH